MTSGEPGNLIILLTGDLEAQHLGDRLHAQSPELIIEHALDRAGLDELFDRLPTGRRRLIAFCTGVIVPSDMLKNLGAGAYNFHPGPPDYPGNHAAGFALYSDAPRFGTTAHVMEAKADSGSIIGTRLFDIPPDCDREKLETLTYQEMLWLFDELLPELADFDHAPPPLETRWSGNKTTTKDLEAMYQGWSVLDDVERSRRTRAFGGPDN